MKLHKLTLVAGATLVAMGLGTFPAHAEGLYIGGSLGTLNYPSQVNGIAGSGTGLNGKVFGGYQLTPHFALEAGAADFGRIDNSNGKVSGRSVYLDAVGMVPLNDRWSALGRLGLARVSLDTSNGDSSGSGLKVGLGAQYALTSRIALRAEWERYRPSVFGQKPDIDQYSIGLRMGF